MNIDYIAGIPLSTNAPSADQPKMLINTTAVNSWVNVDHIGFQNNLGGYHTDIHMVDQGSGFNPARITGIGQLFGKMATLNGLTSVCLFYKSDTGVGDANALTQITAPKNTVASANGYTFLPGGIILQWGNYSASGGNFSSGSTTNASAGENVITLPVPYPNNLFFVGGNLLYTQANLPSGTGTLNVRQSQLNSGTISTLSWQVYCNTNNYLGFDWIALGN